MRPLLSGSSSSLRLRPASYQRPIQFSSIRMYSQRPPWLEAFHNDSSRPPKLFAWKPSNLNCDSNIGTSWSASTSSVSGDSEQRIYVLGIGNLGRLFASSLAQAPERPPITLVVHRKELLAQWMEGQGIELLRSGTLERNKDFDIEWWTESRPETGPVSEVAQGGKLKNLIITTKASAALPQVDLVRGYLDRNSTVAFAQNGMSKLWPPHGPTYVNHRFTPGDAPNFLACVTTHGVTSQGPFRSLHASQADVTVGSVLPNESSSEQSAYLMKQMLQAPHLNVRSVSRGELWVLQLEKLVVNAIINPLTAILRCKNGALFTEPDGVIASIINQLLSEASHVLQLLVAHESSAEVIGQLSNQDETAATQADTRLDLSPSRLHERFSQPHLKEMVYRVGHKVKDNTSSMLQDVRSGRSTEIRDFNGWLVETAAFLDGSLDVAGHAAMVDLVEGGQTLDVDRLGARLNGSGAGAGARKIPYLDKKEN